MCINYNSNNIGNFISNNYMLKSLKNILNHFGFEKIEIRVENELLKIH